MRSALRQQTVRASSTGRLPTRVWFIQDYTHLNIDLRSVIRFIAPKKMRPEIRRRATESKSVNVIVNATTLHQVYLSTDPLLGTSYPSNRQLDQDQQIFAEKLLLPGQW